MADSKKYDGSTWEHSLRKLTTATEAVENPLYSDGAAITSYTIKGNTTTSGTPSPSNPITISGVGNKTANLFDINGQIDAKSASVTISNNSILFDNISGGNIARITFSTQYTAGTYYISCAASGSNYYAVRIFSDSSFTGATYNRYYGGYYRDFAKSGFSTSVTFDNDFKIGFIANAAGGATFTISDIMLSTTEADFEPYGYKIPIINNDVTTPLYLESTVSNRLIKKLVLDGTEDLTFSTSDANRTVCSLTNLGCANALCLCTHIEGKLSYSSNEYNRILTYTSFNGVLYISIEKGLVGSTLETFKAYLSAQYTAGTPVTVYYVLSTAETAAVNEPLMKIGKYADTLSNAAQITTTEGANSITVDTTVQPSEFTATWTGWHNADVKEYHTDKTISDLEDMTISQMQTYTIISLQGGNWS